MNWNWDNFRFFLALAENQTLIAAAAELNVSHTTVLRRIKSLEAQLGAQLFTHSHDGYRLTEKGTKLREQVISLKTSVDSITRSVAGSDSEVDGKVTLTTPDTIGYQLMPTILAKLSDAYPAVQVELLIQNTFTDISRLEADVAIRTGPNPPPDLIGKRLGKLSFTLCASADYLKKHPLQNFPDDLNQHRFISLTNHFQNTAFYQCLIKHRPDDSPTTIADGLMSAYRMCCSGLGIAVLPTYLISKESPLVQIDTPDPIPDNDIWVLSHRDLRNSATVRAVKEFLAKELGQVFAD